MFFETITAACKLTVFKEQVLPRLLLEGFNKMAKDSVLKLLDELKFAYRIWLNNEKVTCQNYKMTLAKYKEPRNYLKLELANMVFNEIASQNNYPLSNR